MGTDQETYQNRMEVIMAEVLLKAEPDKKPEGSQERRDWLSAVLWTYGVFLDAGRGTMFRNRLEE